MRCQLVSTDLQPELRVDLLPANQSAYRRCHSTETAVAAVHNDLVRAADAGHVSALVMLDLSAAFDTVDHAVLLNVLQNRFSVHGLPLDWFRSYLSDRSQTFCITGSQSASFALDCSVPQGSVLGPVEFIAYTEDVTELFRRHQLHYHIYADDKQLYDDVPVAQASTLLRRLADCVSEVGDWCASRRLQLNATKTEFAWFGSHANMLKLSRADCNLSVGGVAIKPSAVVRDLGVLLDAELTMKQHVSQVAKSCFFQLRRIRQIRRCVDQDTAMQLVCSLVLSRLDYCNVVLSGLPKSTLSTLQHVQNTAARLVLGLRSHDHVTQALQQLHWLPVELRIKYKLCLLMHMAHSGQCPSYLRDMVLPTATNNSRVGLRSGSTQRYIEPRLRSRLGQRAFSFSGPSAWNSLPHHLHDISDTACFKRSLKTHYFNVAYH